MSWAVMSEHGGAVWLCDSEAEAISLAEKRSAESGASMKVMVRAFLESAPTHTFWKTVHLVFESGPNRSLN